MSRGSARAWAATFLAVSIPLASCGGGSTTPSKTVLTSLSVSLDPTSIAVGQAATAKASGRDQFGKPIETGAINWTSSSPGIAMVSGAGIVQGIAPGQATINAGVAAVSNSATITVTAGVARRER